MRSKPFVFLKDNSKFYKLRYYDNGNAKTISTGIDSTLYGKEDAEKWADEFMKDPDKHLNPKLPVLLSTYLETVYLPGKTLRDGSVKHVRYVINSFIASKGDRYIHAYTKEDFDTYYDSKATEIKPHTLKGHKRQLNALFEFARKDDRIERNPVERSKPIKARQTKIVYFTVPHFRKLINTIDDKLIRDITLFAVYTGMRSSEFLGLKKSNVFLKKRIIHNYQNKVDEYNVVSIADDIMPIVKEYMKKNDSEYLFNYEFKKTKISVVEFSKRFKVYVKKAKLPEHYCAKTLRKTFGSTLYQKKVNLERISDLMGHSDTRITKKHYASLNEDYDDSVNKIRLKERK